MILSCTCSSAYQDATHGKGNRAHNPMAKEDSFRCTVCSHERTKGAGDKDKKSDPKLGKSKS